MIDFLSSFFYWLAVAVFVFAGVSSVVKFIRSGKK